MLCEEAGEVLEAHTLTAFLPGVEPILLSFKIEGVDLNECNHTLKAIDCIVLRIAK
jgi:hypothetical protein